jgi:CyaY protein
MSQSASAPPLLPESDFLAQAHGVLDRIEHAIDRAADVSQTDLDYARKAEGILELSFEGAVGDSKIIVNLQTPMREIWVAAKSGGYHFRLQDGAWRDTRSGAELFAALSQYASEQAGEPVALGQG